MIKIKQQNTGFFSNCSLKLNQIVAFINSNKRLPDNVDSSQLFELYKNFINRNNDITFHYFENYHNIRGVNILYPINYNHTHQYKNYNDLDYKCITPLIKKYFSPSTKINKIVNILEKKYDIIHENTLAVYYRGTDKKVEAKLASFDDFYNQIIQVININKKIKILIQTDSAKFIDYINGKKLKNIIIINENKTSYTDKGIHNEQTKDVNYYAMLLFLSTVLIISKCKYIICSSGNCSVWIMMYRGNGKNVIQYLRGCWYNSVF